MSCSWLPQSNLIEDKSINIVGKVDVKEGFLLIAESQSQSGSCMGDIIDHI